MATWCPVNEGERVAIDDHSKLADTHVLSDETAGTCAQFVASAAAFLAGHGVQVRAVMTGAAPKCTRARAFHDIIETLGV